MVKQEGFTFNFLINILLHDFILFLTIGANKYKKKLLKENNCLVLAMIQLVDLIHFSIFRLGFTEF